MLCKPTTQGLESKLELVANRRSYLMLAASSSLANIPLGRLCPLASSIRCSLDRKYTIPSFKQLRGLTLLRRLIIKLASRKLTLAKAIHRIYSIWLDSLLVVCSERLSAQLNLRWVKWLDYRM